MNKLEQEVRTYLVDAINYQRKVGDIALTEIKDTDNPITDYGLEDKDICIAINLTGLKLKITFNHEPIHDDCNTIGEIVQEMVKQLEKEPIDEGTKFIDFFNKVHVESCERLITTMLPHIVSFRALAVETKSEKLNQYCEELTKNLETICNNLGEFVNTFREIGINPNNIKSYNESVIDYANDKDQTEALKLLDYAGAR